MIREKHKSCNKNKIEEGGKQNSKNSGRKKIAQGRSSLLMQLLISFLIQEFSPVSYSNFPI